MVEIRIVGFRGPGGIPCVLAYEGRDVVTLDPVSRIRNHSPTGFEWGYSGSGPAQLALALLFYALRDEGAAEAAHQEFKSEVVARLDWRCWTMTVDQIWDWWLFHAQLVTAGTDAEEEGGGSCQIV